MNAFTRFLLNRICRRLVVQGPEHKSNIVEYFRIMKNAAEREFTEDNEPTLWSFLAECYNEAIGKASCLGGKSKPVSNSLGSRQSMIQELPQAVYAKAYERYEKDPRSKWHPINTSGGTPKLDEGPAAPVAPYDPMTQARRHLNLRRPSLGRIERLCEEADDHDMTWYEFKETLESIVRNEDRVIEMLSEELGKGPI